MSANISQLNSSQLAALRHLVYSDLLAFLPVASYDQACRFVANLRLADGGGLGTMLTRFLTLRVTSDISEVWREGTRDVGPYGKSPDDLKMYTIRTGPPTLQEIEQRLNAKWGDRLARVSGFYKPSAVGGQQSAAWRLNIPKGCALYGYRSGLTAESRGLIAGILIQPLAELNRFWLLSSSKHNGPRATPLSPADRQYFSQFEEVDA